MCGIGAELGQAMNELAYDYLDAPVGRLHTDPISHPFAPALERAMLVSTEKIVAGAREVLDGRTPAQSHWRTDNAAPSLAAPPAIPASAAPPLSKRPAVDVSAFLRPPLPDADEPAGEPITMPFGDLTVSEGKIVRWLKNEGEKVAAGELIAEIETDKAVVEIEAPMAGRLARIEQAVGAVVPMGGRIGLIQPES
jgi:2-oxoisovalerate dehydrogenase E1 component